MSETRFGLLVWNCLNKSPLGSLPKREVEILLLRAAIDAGLVDAEPSKLAHKFRIPLTRAHGYLTDLALREPSLSDSDALSELIDTLSRCEVLKDDTYLSLPLQNAALRIWLERKMSILSLGSGETIRRDLVKLTPAGLAKLLGASENIVTPYAALQSLPAEVKRLVWAIEAKKSWDKSIKWPEAMGVLGNTVTVAQTVIPVLFKVFGA